MAELLTDWLGNPAVTDYVDGEDTLVRYFLKSSSVATGISPVKMEGVQEITPDAVKYEKEEEIYQLGGGRTKIKVRPKFNVNIPMFSSKVGSFIAAIHGQAFGSSGYYGQVLTFDDIPRCNIEIAYRMPDMTHVGSLALCNLIPLEFSPGAKQGNQVVSIPFYSRFVPVMLAAGQRCVMDRFQGDGSAVTFTLSQTPLSLMDMNVGAKDMFSLDNLIYVQTKATGVSVGTIVKQDITLVVKALTFEVAPLATEIVEVFYTCAVV